MQEPNFSLPQLAMGGAALVALAVGAILWLGGGDAAATSGSAQASQSYAAPQQGAEMVQAASRPATAGTLINGRELTEGQVADLVAMYGRPPPPGNFWYDPVSGLYGLVGSQAAGYIRPGHDFGPLSPNASNGHTGVFINGRQINDVELQFLQLIFGGQVQQGRAWLDGRTWNFGAEGSPYAMGNLALALQQAQRNAAGGRGGSDWGWRDGSGSVAASDGNCTMMAVPGAPVYSSGC